jgi:CheY-like chemotaxis protein
VQELEDDPGPVQGDAGRLQQVAVNLLTNAVKFTPTGGSITLRLTRDAGYASITVSDTGNGIGTEFLPHIFERFRQADASSTRTHGGLGLGLAIVRDLVEAHGGSVTAASDGIGWGATFTVRLPLSRADAAELELAPDDAAAARPLPVAALNGYTLLVVDDEEDTRAALRSVLETEGAGVRVAGSSEQALGMLADWQPDVIVTDLGMPGEDGFGFLAHLRARSPGAPVIPAIALTAYSGADMEQRCQAAGFSRYLVKPVVPDSLVHTIRELLPRPV